MQNSWRMPALIGTVKFFNPAKGFGFLTQKSGQEIFFHLDRENIFYDPIGKWFQDTPMKSYLPTPKPGSRIFYRLSPNADCTAAKDWALLTLEEYESKYGKMENLPYPNKGRVIPMGARALQGIVIDFDDKKGFGFIKSESYDDDVYFNLARGRSYYDNKIPRFSGMKIDMRLPMPKFDDRIFYEAIESDGRMMAKNWSIHTPEQYDAVSNGLSENLNLRATRSPHPAMECLTQIMMVPHYRVVEKFISHYPVKNQKESILWYGDDIHELQYIYPPAPAEKDMLKGFSCSDYDRLMLFEQKVNGCWQQIADPR